MDEKEMIEMLNQRDEEALKLISDRYGRLCRYIANNILSSGNCSCSEDSEECFNDVLLEVWNTIPPQKPSSLSAYISTLTRWRALDRLKQNRRRRLNINEADIMLSEVEEFVGSSFDLENEISNAELWRMLNLYLAGLDITNRKIFVRRYYYNEDYKAIANGLNLTENAVKQRLKRMRNELYKILNEGEICNEKI
ncbi:MAG TPA: sigma-70 family RNA polymerase sigma factor [Clostridiales bacterium]|nr:sigma-70 family RNA polymerase sigma factor [Clostridiales bacterium]